MRWTPNPISDGTWSYTWTQGRKLQQISKSGTTASYKYNSDGIRTEKTVNGVTTVYNVVGGQVTWEKTGSNNPIYYLYDASGELWGLKYTDNSMYFYVRNAQGDITKIVNKDGNEVVAYAYDAWGNLMSTTGSLASTLGVANPYRYRGYRVDNETGLYYLGRWLCSSIFRVQSARRFSLIVMPILQVFYFKDRLKYRR